MISLNFIGAASYHMGIACFGKWQIIHYSWCGPPCIVRRCVWYCQ